MIADMTHVIQLWVFVSHLARSDDECFSTDIMCGMHVLVKTNFSHSHPTFSQLTNASIVYMEFLINVSNINIRETTYRL